MATNLSIHTSRNSLEHKKWSPLPENEENSSSFARTQLPFPPPLTREMFAAADFNCDKFLANRRHLPLDELKRELNAHLRSLKNELVEMINRDYASFVDLSTKLKGVDKVIEEISQPLRKMREEQVRFTLQGVVDSLEQKLAHRASIREKKACLQLFINIYESVRKVEALLLINSDNSVSLSSSSSGDDESANSAKQIERVAIEYNQMQYLVNKGKGLPFVENIDWRITRIKDTLRANLTAALRSALQPMKIEANYTSSKDTLTQILRTYALIDQTKAAEEVIREEMVKPFVQVTVTRQFLEKSPQPILIPSTNVVSPSQSTFSPTSRTFAPHAFLSSSKDPLAIMYNKVLGFISNDCFLLLEITRKVLKGTSYEILVNSVWVEVVESIMKRLLIIFNPGNPNVFHKNYTISMNFVSSIENMCYSKKTLLYLRTHPTYLEFIKRWQLAVYFQLRFREISLQVENTLSLGLILSSETNNESHDSSEVKLLATKSIITAIERCWSVDVFVYGLSHRFWKLTLQLIQRYKNWLSLMIGDLGDSNSSASEKQSSNPTMISSSSSRTSSGSPTPSSVSISEASEEQILKQLAVITFDIENFTIKIKQLFREVIMTQLPPQTMDEPLIEESIKISLLSIQSDIPEVSRTVTTILIKRCAEYLRQTRGIITQYRYKNREPPTEFSYFVPTIMKPLIVFCDLNQHILTESRRKEWSLMVAEGVTMRYYKNVSETLATFKRTEESHKFKRNRAAGNNNDTATSMNDEDKMRLQIFLDVKQFGRELENLGVVLADVASYAELFKAVEPYGAIGRQ
ncbi:6870_t:CDS:10 [Ambispora gerdemannii]|uniref:Conserved oligomeric Golgi complex subunit 2 n=1 Tax=Ambispora gerdemannii TaxID=144530 RepID=A0A9N9A0A8_9GLOM|nr:6870_t:CDS:10 [Ambispora gerdemannii]